MENNSQVIYGLIERMALVSDAIDSLFANGKKVIVIELNKFDFEQTKRQFKNVDLNLNQFKIDISGIEFIFILDELLNVSEDKTEETLG
jgi:hypothetical protein